MPIKKYPLKVRRKAFRMWRQNEHNCLDVSKQLKAQGYQVSHVTVSRWAEGEDWEAKEAITQNELRRIMRQSDDPVLRELVMDDLEFARFLRQLSGVLSQLFKSKRARLAPRSLKEAIDIAKYIREQREVLLGSARPAVENNPRVTNIYNDNRKQVLKAQLEGLPLEQKRFVLSQVRDNLDQTGERAEKIRKQMLDAKNSA